ncbi:MAG: transcription elongation factor GreA [bacterium]
MTKYLTAEGLEKLKKELDHLEKVERREISEKIRQTAAFGDLKENFAYHEAKDAQGFLEGRIRELKGVIAGAKVIEKNRSGKVQAGSIVLLDSSDGQREGKEEFQIVGPEEADIFKGKISYQSPLGAALLGKTKGDKAVIKSSDGIIEYKILEIK